MNDSLLTPNTPTELRMVAPQLLAWQPIQEAFHINPTPYVVPLGLW